VLCATIARVVGDALSDPYDLVAKLPSDAAVAPNHVYTSAADRVQPAPDSYRGLQHSLDQLGVDAARSVSTGAGVRVAVLDSAPETDHPDLPPVRVARIKGGPHDVGVHGTLTTGVIAAIANNGFGIAGVAPSAVVIAIPVCTPLGATPRDSCGLFELLRGLDLAWKERAQVLNLSLVGPANPLLERAVNRHGPDRERRRAGRGASRALSDGGLGCGPGAGDRSAVPRARAGRARVPPLLIQGA
jgi:subtilisin family serine protease